MGNGLKTWITYACTGFVGGALALNGCSPNGDTINNIVDSDGGAPTVGDSGVPQRCKPAAKECVTASTARVCPADGSDWATVQCKAGEKCDAGDCKADANALCTKGQGSCLNPTTALRCRDNLAGFEQITCPASTTCTGDGLCAGACVVGSSKCTADGNVATCADGKSYTPTACAAGQRCVATATKPIETAACMAAECTPQAGDPTCGAVCGNKADAAADQTKFTSLCVATPTGYKWAPSACLTPSTCAPGSQACGGGPAQASCRTDCTPGQKRCSPNQLGTQLCGADGKWAAAITACNADPTSSALLCMTSPADPTTVLCGDPICDAGQTTCAGAQVRKCGNDGKLAAATACATGTCVATGGAPIGGVVPGSCQAQCQAGDERCSPGLQGQFQTCVNGLWSNNTVCPVGSPLPTTCQNFTSSLGRPAKICGGANTCIPGTTQCQTATVGNDSIRVCSAAGVWGTTTACAVGRCDGNAGGGGNAACIAQCIPGALVCMGGAKAVAGTDRNGTAGFGACSATGVLPTGAATTTCAGAEVCRKGANGNTITQGAAATLTACLECVGPGVAGGNELAQTDVRCSDGTHTQQCAATNTWTAGTTADCAALKVGGVCNTAVSVCANFPRRPGTPHTQSFYINNRGQPGGCAGRGHGVPVACGVTPDCCSQYCSNVSSGSACR